MDIRFSLLSILSVGFLLFFAIQGGDVTLHSLEVGFSADSQGTTITVDPVFAVWVPQLIVYSIGCNACAYGNVMVLDKEGRSNLYGEYLLAHESNHIEQFRALGWWIYPAQYLINIEPGPRIPTIWNNPSQCDHTMWLPPDWWISQWHFISLTRLS